MMEQVFNALTLAMTDSFEIALAAAFGWGVLSILLSPCHLSSIPLVIGYISAQGLTTARKSTGLALLFALGILITIALIGGLTAGFGRMLGDVGIWRNILVAIVFFVMGLYLLDVVKLSWGGGSGESAGRRGWIGALSLGLIFGVGLGPCTFAFLAPVLGVVFGMSTSSFAKAAMLIAAFGIGHCLVIAAAGSFAHVVRRYLTWSGHAGWIMGMRRIAGLCVIAGGFYFVLVLF